MHLNTRSWPKLLSTLLPYWKLFPILKNFCGPPHLRLHLPLFRCYYRPEHLRNIQDNALATMDWQAQASQQLLDEFAAAAAEGDRFELTDDVEGAQRSYSTTRKGPPDADSLQATSSSVQHLPSQAQSIVEQPSTASTPSPSGPPSNPSPGHDTLDRASSSVPHQPSSEEPNETLRNELANVSQMTEGKLAKGMHLWERVFLSLPPRTVAASRNYLVKKSVMSMSDEDQALLAATTEYMSGMFQNTEQSCLDKPLPSPSAATSAPPLTMGQSSVPKRVSFASNDQANVRNDKGRRPQSSGTEPTTYAEAVRNVRNDYSTTPSLPATTTGRSAERNRRKEKAGPGPLILHRIRDGRIQHTTPQMPSPGRSAVPRAKRAQKPSRSSYTSGLHAILDVPKDISQSYQPPRRAPHPDHPCYPCGPVGLLNPLTTYYSGNGYAQMTSTGAPNSNWYTYGPHSKAELRGRVGVDWAGRR